MSNLCRICGIQGDHQAYTVKEMMFGTREEFEYFQCSFCGCLQIEQIPEDLGRYYPENYYSFRSYDKLAVSKWRSFRYALRNKRGQWLERIAGAFVRPPKHLAWVRNSGADLDSKILDIGCGNGKTLLKMHLGGFRQCVGLDPFIQETLRYHNGVVIHKQSLQEFRENTQEKFDLIMFHHSLEHMGDPQEMINTAAALLADRGRILIRVPVADSYAWEHYRENWMQIDAPRHLYLLTRKSMSILAENSELKVDRIDYDSTKGQFIGSELYQQDIPGNSNSRDKQVFNRSQLRSFKRKTRELNQKEQGDQAVFYFCR